MPTVADFSPASLPDEGVLFGTMLPYAFLVKQSPPDIVRRDFVSLRVDARDRLQDLRLSFIIPAYLIARSWDLDTKWLWFSEWPLAFATLTFEGRIVVQTVDGQSCRSPLFTELGTYPSDPPTRVTYTADTYWDFYGLDRTHKDKQTPKEE